MPSRAEYVAIIRSVVTQLAERMSMPPSAVEDLQVAISEACANVVRHAYPEGIAEEPGLLVRCSTEGEKIIAEVIDRGCGFDGDGCHDPDTDGGFGLILIQQLMDQVHWSSSPDSGTTIRMVKSRGMVDG